MMASTRVYNSSCGSMPRPGGMNRIIPAGTKSAQMLTAMGFQVEATDRARKALERLDAGTTGIDLLLTDVIMPDGLNGVDLATLIRARFPALPIIVTSGYNDVAAGAAFPVLRKPVPYDDLYRAICSSLRSARGNVSVNPSS